MPKAKEFLNPSSMTTPGMAGALSMTIANTISCQFKLADPWPAAIALLMSFVCGLLVLTAEAMPLWRRLAYYVVNSFIIFTVAVGSNTLGQTAASATGDSSARASFMRPHLAGLAGIALALAQPDETGWCCLNDRVNQSSAGECEKWGGRFFVTEDEAREACKTENFKTQTQQQQRFFRPWFQGQ